MSTQVEVTSAIEKNIPQYSCMESRYLRGINIEIGCVEKSLQEIGFERRERKSGWLAHNAASSECRVADIEVATGTASSSLAGRGRSSSFSAFMSSSMVQKKELGTKKGAWDQANIFVFHKNFVARALRVSWHFYDMLFRLGYESEIPYSLLITFEIIVHRGTFFSTFALTTPGILEASIREIALRAICSRCASNNSFDTAVWGRPALEGWYPRASSKLLSFEFPRKPLQKNVAFDRIAAKGIGNPCRTLKRSASLVSLWTTHRKLLCLDSTIPILLCRRAERGSNIVPHDSRARTKVELLNSGSAETTPRGPCESIHIFLNVSDARSIHLEGRRVVSEYPVALSLACKIGFPPISWMNRKSTWTWSLNVWRSLSNNTFFVLFGLPVVLQLVHLWIPISNAWRNGAQDIFLPAYQNHVWQWEMDEKMKVYLRTTCNIFLH